jgi:hypothetical protein
MPASSAPALNPGHRAGPVRELQILHERRELVGGGNRPGWSRVGHQRDARSRDRERTGARIDESLGQRYGPGRIACDSGQDLRDAKGRHRRSPRLRRTSGL